MCILLCICDVISHILSDGCHKIIFYDHLDNMSLENRLGVQEGDN